MLDPASETIARIAMELHDAPGTEQTLALLVDHARAAVLCDDAGVLLSKAGGRLEPGAQTAERVLISDLVQQRTGEGPCVSSLETGDIYLVRDVLTDPRWPDWSEAVAATGIRSALGIPLMTGQRTLGALNLYSDAVDNFGEDEIAVAHVFARHASIALAAATEQDGLRIAIDARKRIGQAQGILMERYDLDEDRSFAVLLRYSQHHNIKLSAVADEVVRNRRLPDAPADQNGVPPVTGSTAPDTKLDASSAKNT